MRPFLQREQKGSWWSQPTLRLRQGSQACGRPFLRRGTDDACGDGALGRGDNML